MSRGSRSRLGAHWSPSGTRFAVYSAHAEAIDLCLLGPTSGDVDQRHPLERGAEDVWSVALEGIEPGQRYGYRARGDADAGVFRSEKLLLDPYALAIEAAVDWHASWQLQSPLDSAPFAPRSIVVDPRFGDPVSGQPSPRPSGPRPSNPRPKISWTETVIYEAHVRGLTMTHPGVAEGDRGRFSGVASEAVLDHLQALGVTSIELMPVFQFVSESHLGRRGASNYWGYSPIGFFAPHSGYASSAANAPAEFQQMVETFHARGLEVILDVVFNHTGEGPDGDLLIGLRGLDDRSYYRRDAGGTLEDFTGCGNTLDGRRRAVRHLIVDALRFWAETYRVDGFRFDLATVLGRSDSGFGATDTPLAAISRDPVLSQLKLIAEPWDLGLEGYQAGQFPAPWVEWTDRCRDLLRRYWQGMGQAADRAEVATELASYLARSQPARLQPARSLPSDDAPSPSKIGFITCHDGFTLRDLVSYDHKHNEANGEANRDGSNHNHSRNWGVEGPTDHPAVERTRLSVSASLLTTLALSGEVPMLSMGDELGRSQHGNNNAYCQDNEVSWMNWRAEPGWDRRSEVAEWMAFSCRWRRELPLFCWRELTWHAHVAPPSRHSKQPLPPGDGCLALAACRSSSADTQPAYLLLLNPTPEAALFQLPRATSRQEHWSILLNSSSRGRGRVYRRTVRVAPHSALVFEPIGVTTAGEATAGATSPACGDQSNSSSRSQR